MALAYSFTPEKLTFWAPNKLIEQNFWGIKESLVFVVKAHKKVSFVAWEGLSHAIIIMPSVGHSNSRTENVAREIHGDFTRHQICDRLESAGEKM